MIQRLLTSVKPLRLPLLIAFVVLVSAGVIVYVQFALKRIEGELPLRVMQEKQDIERVARNYFEFLAATETALTQRTEDSVARMNQNLAVLSRDLKTLRERYTFDTLIGASAFHAALSPVMDDVQIWMSEGFGDLPSSSPVVLEIVATRARDALSKVYDKTTEADRIAYEILQQRSLELRRLRIRLMAVLAVFALLAGSFVWLAIRQQRASKARERAEEERIRAQSRLQDALESTSEGFAFFDAEDRLVICNTRYREFFLRGIRDIVVPGVTFDSILKTAAQRGIIVDAEHDHENWTAWRLERFRQPTGPFAQELSDGRWIQINERKTAENGTVVVYSDITPLKQRELELLDAKEGAEAANEAKGAFLANVSHELRTPLTSILGFTQIVKKRLDQFIFPRVVADDDRVARAMRQVGDNIDIVLVEGERLTTLVNNVLDLEKIEAGKMVWNIESLDVADVLDQAAAATRSLYELKGLEFSVDVASDLPRMRGDRDKVVQVIINLISNAVKFTDHGRVECRASTEPPSSVAISVSDTGSGISPEEQQLVFEKFRQVGDTLTEKPAGTGLGLSICKEIVEHLGGTIFVDSVPGQGSTFRFTLPVVKTGATSSELAAELE